MPEQLTFESLRELVADKFEISDTMILKIGKIEYRVVLASAHIDTRQGIVFPHLEVMEVIKPTRVSRNPEAIEAEVEAEIQSVAKASRKMAVKKRGGRK